MGWSCNDHSGTLESNLCQPVVEAQFLADHQWRAQAEILNWTAPACVVYAREHGNLAADRNPCSEESLNMDESREPGKGAWELGIGGYFGN